MALKLENINNLISDDLASRNENWTEIDTTFGLKADKLLATNLVTNGDFSNGMTGCVKGNNIVDFSIVDTKLTFKGVGSVVASIENGIRFTSVLNATDLFYIKVDAQSEVDNSDFVLSVGYGAVANKVGLVSKQVSVVTKNTVAFSNFLTISGASGVVFTVDNVIGINLTQTFGAGNEPTKEQMDRLLSEFPNSWFNGTQELLPLKLLPDVFAMKQQEAWITPTLLNGATGTLQYRKNSTGRLEFKGTLSKSTTNNPAFKMAIGYRVENETRLLVGCADTTSGFLAFFNDGIVFVLTANKVFQMGSVTLI